MGFELTPLGDRVILEPVEQQSVTAAGIHLPDSIRDQQQRGTVVAVGPGTRDANGTLHPVGVELGDVVVYSRFGATEVRVGDAEYLILRESDVLAKSASPR